MALPGVSIPIRPKREKKKDLNAGGLASNRLAKLQEKEAEASKVVLDAINCPPPIPNPQPDPQPDPQPNPLPYEADEDDERYRGFIPANEDDPVGGDNVEVVPVNWAEYYRSPTYQERTLQEEANWRAVLPKVFVAFMPSSYETHQWCDQLWNKNFNKPCRCKDWQMRKVEIDIIDFTSRTKLLVSLCDCTSDLVQLIRLGYMGSSPTQPRTAFLLRLLRLHHILWKHSSIRLTSFTDAIDEYLDPRNPLFEIPGTNNTRDLRKCFSSAVDAYREMLRMEDKLATSALRLTPLDVLAGNCPSCFGPTVAGKRDNEPDHIVCLDANFQQRRHLAASAAWRGDSGLIPSLFLLPKQVRTWKSKMEPKNNRGIAAQPVVEVIDPCSAQHTAANDSRGRQTWRGCDETGLMGLACRHDHLLKFINIVQSGERGYYPLAMLDWVLRSTVHPERETPRFGILYDIGCNMEKGIIKRDLFAQERGANRLKFGTSVFHSYVHQWACQLNYNPRLNSDWGLSDGEGLERIWSSLALLVSALRYSTKAHRLCALNL